MTWKVGESNDTENYSIVFYIFYISGRLPSLMMVWHGIGIIYFVQYCNNISIVSISCPFSSIFHTSGLKTSLSAVVIMLVV